MQIFLHRISQIQAFIKSHYSNLGTKIVSNFTINLAPAINTLTEG